MKLTNIALGDEVITPRVKTQPFSFFLLPSSNDVVVLMLEEAATNDF